MRPFASASRRPTRTYLPLTESGFSGAARRCYRPKQVGWRPRHKLPSALAPPISSSAPDAKCAPFGWEQVRSTRIMATCKTGSHVENDWAGRRETSYGRDAPALRKPHTIRSLFGGVAFGSLHADLATMPPGRPSRAPPSPFLAPLSSNGFANKALFPGFRLSRFATRAFLTVQFRADGVARLNELWQENARPRRSVARPIGGRRCCGSSVVEHSLGKGEVESSILSRSTIKPLK